MWALLKRDIILHAPTDLFSVYYEPGMSIDPSGFRLASGLEGCFYWLAYNFFFNFITTHHDDWRQPSFVALNRDSTRKYDSADRWRFFPSSSPLATRTHLITSTRVEVHDKLIVKWSSNHVFCSTNLRQNMNNKICNCIIICYMFTFLNRNNSQFFFGSNKKLVIGMWFSSTRAWRRMETASRCRQSERVAVFGVIDSVGGGDCVSSQSWMGEIYYPHDHGEIYYLFRIEHKLSSHLLQ